MWKRLALALLGLSLTVALAQRTSPVHWSLGVEPEQVAPGSQFVAKLTAKVDPGYHLYSLSTPKGGPIRTTISLADNPAVARVQVFQPEPHRKFDQNFSLDTETFDGDTTFLLLVTLKKDAPTGSLAIAAQARYQACNAKECFPPVRKTAEANVAVSAGAGNAAPVIPPTHKEVTSEPAKAQASAARSTAPTTRSDAQGLGQFLLVAFGFGLAAIFTPCVFPMIPMTVSFFLGQKTDRRSDSVRQAFTFCLGIVVLFTLLGFLLKAIVGPFGVVQLGSSPWVNGFITLVFLAFGLSLLGAFEITLPSSLLTRLDRASQRGGLFGSLLMGLTFSLTSFACVGPFVGTLLAASVQQQGAQPILGMIAFATGLAFPFFFLALFPGYLQRMPRSGGWLARVKVVMGFIVLAAMLKYLSNVDQVLQWNVLTRERFLAAWFVLFLLPGLYLLGFLRLEGIKPEEPLGLGRMLTAALLLIFSVSLLPGLFGMRLGELEAYIPAGAGGVLAANGPTAEPGPVWMKNQYAEALQKAKQENKLVLVNFTGYACTNCHWMKANMFPRPTVQTALKNLVLVELYTDGTDDASRQNQELQDKLFHTVAIPYYALVDGDGKVIANLAGSTRSEPEFVAFLESSRPPGA